MCIVNLQDPSTLIRMQFSYFNFVQKISPLPGLPLCRHRLHRFAHERILVQHAVEVVDAQREQITVGFRAHAGHAPRIGQQTDLAKVGAVRQRGGHLAVRHHYVHHALLDEVHLGSDCSLFDDDVTCVHTTNAVNE